MNRTKRSVVWKLPRDEFQKIVSQSVSIADVTRKLGLAVAGVHHRVILKRIKEENIDADHIPLGLSSNRGRKFLTKIAIPLELVMVEHSTYSRGQLKHRLINTGILKNECSLCYQQPTWNGQKLVMVIDHINGVRDDHRLENLRLLCPNCNSQQDTFCGKHTKIINHFCYKCKAKVSEQGRQCLSCSNQQEEKIKWPSYEELIKMVQDSSYSAVGRKLGVSDNAVRKKLRRSSPTGN